jgi:hypothetical protein
MVRTPGVPPSAALASNVPPVARTASEARTVTLPESPPPAVRALILPPRSSVPTSTTTLPAFPPVNASLEIAANSSSVNFGVVTTTLPALPSPPEKKGGSGPELLEISLPDPWGVRPLIEMDSVAVTVTVPASPAPKVPAEIFPPLVNSSVPTSTVIAPPDARGENAPPSDRITPLSSRWRSGLDTRIFPASPVVNVLLLIPVGGASP